MKNCTLNYSSYRNIFPIWALGEYRRIQVEKWITFNHYVMLYTKIVRYLSFSLYLCLDVELNIFIIINININ